MTKNILLAIVFVAAAGLGYVYFTGSQSGSASNVVPVDLAFKASEADSTQSCWLTSTSTREQFIAEEIILPLPGSAPTENVLHSIPIEEIRQGCFRQDCIPSVDDPVFMSIDEAVENLPEDTFGLALSYKDVDRFYPFNMLVTREIVNDVVAGDPLLVTYCPLCGTGVVFEREVHGEIPEFGVSGMLWQSNLLMYNRAEKLADRSLWSQVLGEAVVGTHTGQKLMIVPSDIVYLRDWAVLHENGEVLNTGEVGDPYRGDYYEVARQFGPNFDEVVSPLDPSTYVYGIEMAGTFKAYPANQLPVGELRDTVAGTEIIITKSPIGMVDVIDVDANLVPDVPGFWFSWVAAHPDTLLWDGEE